MKKTRFEMAIAQAKKEVVDHTVSECVDIDKYKEKQRRITHLLACLGEECGEVQQIVGKSIRFGIDNHNPHDEYQETNLSKLHKEINDINAVYQMLCEELNEDPSPNSVDIKLKKEKVEYYYRRFYGNPI